MSRFFGTRQLVELGHDQAGVPASTEQFDWKAQAAISEAAAGEKRLAQPPHEIAEMQCF